VKHRSTRCGPIGLRRPHRSCPLMTQSGRRRMWVIEKFTGCLRRTYEWQRLNGHSPVESTWGRQAGSAAEGGSDLVSRVLASSVLSRRT